MFLTLFHGSTRCTGRLSSSILRISSRNLIHTTKLPVRGYATTGPPHRAPPRRTPSSKLPLPTPTRSAGRPLIALNEQSKSKKLQTAERLLNAGNRTLYKSTDKTTFIRAFAYSLTTLAALSITSLWASGFLKLDTFRELGHESPVLVYTAFAVTGVFLGAAAGWALQKTWGHVHKIDLVQQSGSVFLQVTVRSGIPFVKRRLMIAPQKMVVDYRFVAAYSLPPILVPVAPSETSPSAFTAGVLRETMKTVSRFFYSIFEAARVFFSQEGIITVEITEENKGKKRTEKYYLDASALYLQEKDKILLYDIVDTKDPLGYKYD